MLLVGFLLLAGISTLTGLLSLQEYCGRSFFAPYFDPKKTVVSGRIVTADRQLVFVNRHLSVALS